jgi:parallel beta-helix repeat protein
MRTRARCSPVIAAIAGLVLLCPSAGARSPLRCGDVVKRDTTLRQDLVNCPGDGLEIGADGVTLDLGGHMIDGRNADGSEGVSVDGHARVTIRNGAIRQFRVNGVGARKSRRLQVNHLDIEAIGAGGKENEPVSAGIFVQDSDNAEVRLNRVSNAVEAYQSDGIVVLGSKRPRVAANRSSKNAWNGIAVFDSPNARIQDNHTERNVNSGIISGNAAGTTIDGNVSNRQVHPDTGGIVVLATDGLTVTDNRMSGNNAGISLELGVASATVARNRVNGGGDGIALLESDGNTLTHNQVSGVGGIGIYLDAFGPPDASPNGSDGNTLERNHVTGSGLAGFGVFGGSDGNTFTANAARANHGDGSGGDPAGGFYIEASTGNVLDDNTASKNTGDGVLVKSPGNTLKATTALDNLRRGIDAVDGTIDGGGNHAAGNGLSPECTGGVACA